MSRRLPSGEVSVVDAVNQIAKMVTFLTIHPDEGTAWAGVEGMSRTDIPGYVAGLTPVLLLADTAVTNHGCADGDAAAVHPVLQAGTAALVDRYGFPRARGNPLTPPTAAHATDYTGGRWAAFYPAHVVTVAPTSAPMALLCWSTGSACDLHPTCERHRCLQRALT